jgi:hypothetical protein
LGEAGEQARLDLAVSICLDHLCANSWTRPTRVDHCAIRELRCLSGGALRALSPVLDLVLDGKSKATLEMAHVLKRICTSTKLSDEHALHDAFHLTVGLVLTATKHYPCMGCQLVS